MVKTSSTKLNENHDLGHPCLVPDLKEKNFQHFISKYCYCYSFLVDALYQIKEVLSYS